MDAVVQLFGDLSSYAERMATATLLDISPTHSLFHSFLEHGF